MLRIPHCLDSRLTDGGEVVSPTHWPRSTPQKHYCSVSDTHFDLYSSPSITRIIKSRRMRWHEWGEKRNAYRLLVGKPEGKRSLG
jgi:hypothetical protein